MRTEKISLDQYRLEIQCRRTAAALLPIQVIYLAAGKFHGTVAGTAIVKDLFPSGPDDRISNPAVAAGKSVFAINDGTHDDELSVSDGTRVGAHQVMNINLGAQQ